MSVVKPDIYTKEYLEKLTIPKLKDIGNSQFKLYSLTKYKKFEIVEKILSEQDRMIQEKKKLIKNKEKLANIIESPKIKGNNIEKIKNKEVSMMIKNIIKNDESEKKIEKYSNEIKKSINKDMSENKIDLEEIGFKPYGVSAKFDILNSEDLPLLISKVNKDGKTIYAIVGISYSSDILKKSSMLRDLPLPIDGEEFEMYKGLIKNDIMYFKEKNYISNFIYKQKDNTDYFSKNKNLLDELLKYHKTLISEQFTCKYYQILLSFISKVDKYTEKIYPYLNEANSYMEKYNKDQSSSISELEPNNIDSVESDDIKNLNTSFKKLAKISSPKKKNTIDDTEPIPMEKLIDYNVQSLVNRHNGDMGILNSPVNKRVSLNMYKTIINTDSTLLKDIKLKEILQHVIAIVCYIDKYNDTETYMEICIYIKIDGKEHYKKISYKNIGDLLLLISKCENLVELHVFRKLSEYPYNLNYIQKNNINFFLKNKPKNLINLYCSDNLIASTDFLDGLKVYKVINYVLYPNMKTFNTEQVIISNLRFMTQPNENSDDYIKFTQEYNTFTRDKKDTHMFPDISSQVIYYLYSLMNCKSVSISNSIIDYSKKTNYEAKFIGQIETDDGKFNILPKNIFLPNNYEIKKMSKITDLKTVNKNIFYCCKENCDGGNISNYDPFYSTCLKCKFPQVFSNSEDNKYTYIVDKSDYNSDKEFSNIISEIFEKRNLQYLLCINE